jgi:hypothetical protein
MADALLHMRKHHRSDEVPATAGQPMDFRCFANSRCGLIRPLNRIQTTPRLSRWGLERRPKKHTRAATAKVDNAENQQVNWRTRQDSNL